MSVVQNFVGWGITTTSADSGRSANPSARFNSKYSDTATRALAGAGGGGNQDREVDSLVNSLAKVMVGNFKASGDGIEREITDGHSGQHNRVSSKKQASDRDDKNAVANQESAPNFERTSSKSLQTVRKRYEQPTAKAATRVLPRATEQSDDVDSLVGIFDRVKVDNGSDSEDSVQHNQVEEKESQQSPKVITNDRGQLKLEGSGNWSVPPTPYDKGEGDRYYFCSGNNWYCFDEFQNVYFEDGTLLHDASFTTPSQELGPHFYIDHTSFYFYENKLLSEAADGLFYPLQTWHQKYYFHTPSGLHHFDYRRNVFSMTALLDKRSNSYGRTEKPKAGNDHPIAPSDLKLFWPGSPGIDSGGLIPMTFCIGGSVYWFDADVLWCQPPGDRSYRVHTWQTDPNASLADIKHHFDTPSGVYYFDYRRNVFSHDGILVCASSSAIDVGGLLPIAFSIGGTVYWFDVDALWCQPPGDKCYRVHTWQDDPNESLADRKHYFYTSGGLYYFDYRWNVFSNEGELFCASPSAVNPGGLLPVTRCIDGTVYWFDVDVLWCQASGDKCYRVHTWQGEPNKTLKLAERKHHFYVSNILYYLDEYHNLYSEDGKLVCKSSSSLATDELGIPSFQIGDAPFWLHKDGLLSRTTGDALSRVLAWPKDSCASDAKSDSLQTGLLPWSPGNSPPPAGPVPDSSQTRSTAPFFPKPSITQSPPIGPARDIDPEKAQVQPARKRGNKDHLKCPYCEKVCRRPIALKEHIRAHEKDKSEVCPFKDANTGIACDTGFCTKLNMRRHFSIHRAGTLEEYLGLPSLSPRKKRENAALGFDAPYNPYHTGTTRH
ncbi:unnamed protein product [Rhizoctonia solani]|uniref:C2H2-type domain-containing protein n=1 Tax=Rhizoctonia solani TaxID=456999 RepID=A0A8H2XX16_9AGAM|nr:unnamed protein product [Rhizoctonia solani]